MNSAIINIGIKFILIITIIILIIYWLKQTHIDKLEKRFQAFSLQPKNNNVISFFDKISNYLKKWIHKCSKIFKKSQILMKYSQKYEHFTTYEEKNIKENIDYISLKFNIAFLFLFLSLVVTTIKHTKFNHVTILISFIIGFILPDIILHIKFQKKRRQIEDDLLKAVIIMNNSFKAGRNIIQAISTVKNELEGPIADEFKKISLDITYGLSLDVVFNRFYERVKLEDAKYIASSLTLLNKTGGNIVRVFNTIEKSFYNKKKLKNELNSLTASSVFVFRVLVFLPFVFTFVIFILNPTYFTPLFHHPLGIIILIFIALLFTLYVLVIKNVLKVSMDE